jgi:hypothetical protein
MSFWRLWENSSGSNYPLLHGIPATVSIKGNTYAVELLEDFVVDQDGTHGKFRFSGDCIEMLGSAGDIHATHQYPQNSVDISSPIIVTSIDRCEYADAGFVSEVSFTMWSNHISTISTISQPAQPAPISLHEIVVIEPDNYHYSEFFETSVIEL